MLAKISTLPIIGGLYSLTFSGAMETMTAMMHLMN